jgi:membrane-associated phospholipid phosphatase
MAVAIKKETDFSLPIFLTSENKWPAAILMFLLATLLYLASNHNPVFEPQLLGMTWVDRVIPFLPRSVWIYTSEYIFFLIVYINCRDMINLNKYLYAFVALQLISVTIFFFWPTTYPRDLFPLPDHLDPLTSYVFNSLRQTDMPTNCCPSLHVSSVFLSVFIFLDDQRKKFPLFFLWGIAISVSTLTTKQHYLVDVIAGFLLATLLYWVFHRLVPYRSNGPANPSLARGQR